jgi:hypothetical protein
LASGFWPRSLLFEMLLMRKLLSSATGEAEGLKSEWNVLRPLAAAASLLLLAFGF